MLFLANLLTSTEKLIMLYSIASVEYRPNDSVFTDHLFDFSGLDRTIGPVCVCVCVCV